MKKITVVGIVTIIIVAIIVLFVVAVTDGIKIMKTREEEENKRQELMMTYLELNNAFLISTGAYEFEEMEGTYQKLPAANKYGINAYKYLYLQLYEKQTGMILQYDKVVDYFSQEYEKDGSLRLYNNGLHPEIENYVQWGQGKRDEMLSYAQRIWSLYNIYVYEKKNNKFVEEDLDYFSPQMLDELVKKEANPDYELDLLAIQKQGY